MKRVLMGIIVTVALSTQASMIYEHDFGGTTTNSLSGTAPDTDNYGGTNLWVGGAGIKVDGSITSNINTSATLAFTPTNGTVYQLDVTLDATTVNGDWIGFGFVKGQSSLDNSAQNRFIAGETVGQAWAIVKGDPSVAKKGNSTHREGSGNAIEFPGTSPNALEWRYETSEMNLRIILNTSNAVWNAIWYAKLTSESEYTVMRSEDLSANNINSVGIVSGFGSGWFSSFKLQDLNGVDGGGGTTNTPVITSINISGSNMVVAGTNGNASAEIRLIGTDDLTSTNLWGVITNATTDGAGGFSVTAAMDATNRFFKIEQD
jgi:hypothetical protein